MRSISIVGIGITPFGALPEGIAALAVRACCAALADAGIGPERIEAFFLGNFAGGAFTGQNHLAPVVAHGVGLGPVPCTRVEGACASAGLALRQAIMAVRSGAADIVLAGGVEKMTTAPLSETTSILAAAGDHEAEACAGATFPALFALIALRHMHEYGTPREALAEVAVKNHANGCMNPNAHMRKLITREQALDARPVAESLGLYDCSLISDGAAAVVVCPTEMAADLHPRPVRVLASAQASGSPALQDKADITRFEATDHAGREAFRQAGLNPEDVDLAEVHDCFTISEIVALEDLGFFPKGEGGRGALEGRTALGGAMPVNTSGGLKAKGHPVGATGIAQIHEIVTQLRGEAGARQVPGAEVGLAQNMGGSGATSVVHVLSSAG